MSNFQMVEEFHEVFGHPNPTETQFDIIKDSPKLMEFRTELIQSEFDEFKDAIKNNDFIEMVDALGDMLYVIYGTAVVAGVNMDDVFSEIHDSNMSKMCNTEQEAIDTIEYYKTLPGFETTQVAYRLAKDNRRYVIYNAETGKILKSKYFRLPNIANCLIN